MVSASASSEKSFFCTGADGLQIDKAFYQKNKGLSSLKASNVWVWNFKSMYGIRELDVSGKKLSAAPKVAGFLI